MTHRDRHGEQTKLAKSLFPRTEIQSEVSLTCYSTGIITQAQHKYQQNLLFSKLEPAFQLFCYSSILSLPCQTEVLGKQLSNISSSRHEARQSSTCMQLQKTEYSIPPGTSYESKGTRRTYTFHLFHSRQKKGFTLGSEQWVALNISEMLPPDLREQGDTLPI